MLNSRKNKKIFAITSAGIFSAFIILGSLSYKWHDGVAGSVSYKAEPVLLSANGVGTTDKNTLSDWEKNILARQKNIIPRVSGAYSEELAKSVLEEFFLADQKPNESVLVENVLQKNPVDREIARKAAPSYQISDLKITGKNDSESLRNYGNKIGEIAVKYAFAGETTDPSEILAKAMMSKNSADLIALEAVVKNYNNLIAEYLKTEVPAEISSGHLNMINALNGVKNSVQNFESVLIDPIDGILVLTNYAGYGADLHEALKQIDSYLKKNKIVFSEDELGYVIERAIQVRVAAH